MYAMPNVSSAVIESEEEMIVPRDIEIVTISWKERACAK
jgi:hypothetical protein